MLGSKCAVRIAALLLLSWICGAAPVERTRGEAVEVEALKENRGAGSSAMKLSRRYVDTSSLPPLGRLSKRAESSNTNTTTGQASILSSLAHYLEVGIGTPSQPQILLLDTGSSDLLIFDASSNQCQESEYGCNGGFNTSLSSTYVNATDTFTIGYANVSNTAQGYFMNDTVHIAGLEVESQRIALVTDALLDYDIQGVLGLNFASKSQALEKEPGLLENMFKQGLMGETQLFSIYLGPRKGEVSNGTIAFGESEPEVYTSTGELDWIPIAQEDDFYVTVGGVKAANGTTLSTGNFTAILDAGTIPIILADELADAVAESIDVDAEYDESLPGYLVDCKYLTKSTTYLTFSLPTNESTTLTLNIPYSDLIRSLSSSTPKKCLLDVLRSSSYNIGQVLGDTFLSSTYVSFDMTNQLVGMGQAVHVRLVRRITLGDLVGSVQGWLRAWIAALKGGVVRGNEGLEGATQ